MLVLNNGQYQLLKALGDLREFEHSLELSAADHRPSNGTRRQNVERLSEKFSAATIMSTLLLNSLIYEATFAQIYNYESVLEAGNQYGDVTNDLIAGMG